ncbi:MAG TPA: gephyrin-like molybdotransferase Glp [Verrucomicrobiae bacterium]|nr:gephyrin-like molybdotransferase Glp [Verrucomicrobiae bacterium]
MLDLETALDRVLAALPPPRVEAISLTQTAGRVLVEPFVSPSDLPPFDNSAMDGYAVRADDVRSAKAETPVRLRIKARIPAGESFSGVIEATECARLFTGSPIPRGADAVVMQEDTRVDPNRPDEVLVCDSAKPGENVRRQGEDLRKGTTLLEKGAELTAAAIALLGATGVSQVSVGKRPVVGLLATGSELREPGEPLSAGQIYESNRAMLSPLVASAGGIPKVYPIIPDTLQVTRSALELAFNECDCVVTSGGVSVGEMDFVKAAFEALGGGMNFWKVAIRPGKPFVFGSIGQKFLFGLPGNPVSAFVTFLLLVRPALRRWQGARDTSLPTRSGILGEAITNPAERRHFVRVRVNEKAAVFASGAQASHVLTSLAGANGLLDLPPQAALAAGTPVRVLQIS